MLRPLFFKLRSLRGQLARLAWETVHDLMAATSSVIIALGLFWFVERVT